jgi:hypothetical protein
MRSESPALICLPSTLLDVLSREDTVLFVGAGASVWAGLPSWPRLVEELADFIERTGASAEIVRRELSRNDLLQAASYGVDLLTPFAFGEFIRAACRRDSAQPAEIHALIAALKPACFITTNYDQLLERAIRRARPDTALLVVSNRQLTETADIVQARAKNFVFKPHGDVDDAEGVVLTREQYRALRYQKPHVIHALTTLLASRPVVFIGFGLRDPDFFLVKDFLIETYRGSARDHYAIVADATPAEVDYWRRQYGIHLISYATKSTPSGGDHAELLALLRQLAGQHEAAAIAVHREIASLLTQYAARLAALPFTVADHELPLRVRRRSADRRGHNHEEALGSFTADRDRVALLIGAPGAGKTYAIRRYVSSQAARILLNPDAAEVDVPIHVDMKLYGGSLWRLAEEQLPAGLTLERLMAARHVKFFVDAINEMAQVYIDGGHFHADLADFMRRVQGSSIIATSRSEQGVTAFGHSVYDLDSLAIEYVERHLEREQIDIAAQWHREVIDLLRKPLFFRLFAQHTELFRNLATPNAFYERLFLRIGDRLQQRTGLAIDVARVLDQPAFEALNRAQELIPAESIVASLSALAGGRDKAAQAKNAIRVFEALLSEGVLIPHPHGTVALFHQTATEYLAAPRLARAIGSDAAQARRLLGRTYWDHSFLLALERVPRHLRRDVFMSLLQLDRLFAGRAVRYMGADSGWAALEFLRTLDRTAGNSAEGMQFDWIIRNFPSTRVTQEALLTLAERGGLLGGAAIEALASGPLSRRSRARIIQLILNHLGDYNFGSRAAPVLAVHLTASEVETVFRRLRRLPLDRLDYDSVTSTCAALLGQWPLADALALLERWSVSERVRRGVISDVLYDHLDDEREAVVREAFIRVANGSQEAIFPAYIALRHRGVDRDLLESLVTPDLINELIRRLRDGDTGRWAAELLNLLGGVVAAQPYLVRSTENTIGLARAILLLARGESSRAEFWNELDALSRRGFDSSENLDLLHLLSEVDWRGHLDVLFRFFEIKDLVLAEKLLQFMREDKSGVFGLLFEGEKLDWWVSWFDASASEWQKELLGEVIAIGGPTLHQQILDFFNAGFFRELLVTYVLPRLPERTTDDINADSISWLMKNAHLSLSWVQMSALGALATEDFVVKQLLPALKSARGSRRRAGLLNAIRDAGERHRRRYVDEEGHPLDSDS